MLVSDARLPRLNILLYFREINGLTLRAPRGHFEMMSNYGDRWSVIVIRRPKPTQGELNVIRPHTSPFVPNFDPPHLLLVPQNFWCLSHPITPAFTRHHGPIDIYPKIRS